MAIVCMAGEWAVVNERSDDLTLTLRRFAHCNDCFSLLLSFLGRRWRGLQVPVVRRTGFARHHFAVYPAI